MPVALAFVLGVHAVPAQDAAVGLSASVEGDALEIEVRAAPGTRVVAAVATRLAADGATLAIDDPLFIAASIQPELRGTTGADGAFRTSIPLDPVFRETVAALFIQAARLDPTGSAVSAPSAVVRVPIAAPRGGMAGAAAWMAAAVAALAILVVLPAGIRRGAAGLLAAGVLVATPLLLARAFWTERTTTPFLPYGGRCWPRSRSTSGGRRRLASSS
jgi:hypothetical protein